MRKYTVKYSGYREVFANDEAEAREQAWDCTLSVSECLDIESIEEDPARLTYCEDCEQPTESCEC